MHPQKLISLLATLVAITGVGVGCTGWEQQPVVDRFTERSAVAENATTQPAASEPALYTIQDQGSAEAPVFQPELAATIPGRLDLRPGQRTNPSGTTPLNLTPLQWSSSPQPTTATIPYYVRGEHTSAGYIRGSYRREGEFIRGEQTSTGYIPGNYRGESDNYIRGEHTSEGYIRGNYRSEPLFTTPPSANTVQPSTGPIPQWHP